MHTHSAVSSPAKSLSSLEADSFTNDDQILDFEVMADEVESALSFLKLGRSKGADGLNAEHLLMVVKQLCFGSGRSLRLGKIAWAEMSRNDSAGGLLYYIPLRQ